MERVFPSVYKIVSEEEAEQAKVVPTRDPDAAGDPSVLEKVKIEEMDGTMVSLTGATREALVRHASDKLGLLVSDSHTKKDILSFIVSHEEMLDEMLSTDADDTDTDADPGEVDKDKAKVDDTPPTPSPTPPVDDGPGPESGEGLVPLEVEKAERELAEQLKTTE